MQFVREFSRNNKRVMLGALVVLVLVSAFLVALNKERQNRRTQAIENVLTPGSYGYGGYQDSSYSATSTPAQTNFRGNSKKNNFK